MVGSRLRETELGLGFWVMTSVGLSMMSIVFSLEFFESKLQYHVVLKELNNSSLNSNLVYNTYKCTVI